MPIYAKGGDVKQLGGEFILGPGPVCSYASRMHTTRSHTSISTLLVNAGVDIESDSDCSPQPEHSVPVRIPMTLPVPSRFDAESELRSQRAEICRLRMNRRGGIEHLRWVGDCGLYQQDEVDEGSDDGSDLLADDGQAFDSSHVPFPRELATMHSAQGLNGTLNDERPERIRTLSDPLPVAEWIANVQQAQRPPTAAELHQWVTRHTDPP